MLPPHAQKLASGALPRYPARRKFRPWRAFDQHRAGAEEGGGRSTCASAVRSVVTLRATTASASSLAARATARSQSPSWRTSCILAPASMRLATTAVNGRRGGAHTSSGWVNTTNTADGRLGVAARVIFGGESQAPPWKLSRCGPGCAYVVNSKSPERGTNRRRGGLCAFRSRKKKLTRRHFHGETRSFVHSTAVDIRLCLFARECVSAVLAYREGEICPHNQVVEVEGKRAQLMMCAECRASKPGRTVITGSLSTACDPPRP